MARILIIDDNEGFGRMLQELLERGGYEVMFSPMPIISTEEALRGGYDLITLDLNMPDFEGGDVARLFQERDLKTPVLVISGYLTELMEGRLEEEGLSHFLRKPFTQQQVLDKVGEILQMS